MSSAPSRRRVIAEGIQNDACRSDLVTNTTFVGILLPLQFALNWSSWTKPLACSSKPMALTALLAAG